MIEREGRLGKGVGKERDRVTGKDPLVVIALAFSVNGTAPRRPAAGFATTARSAARIFQGRRAGAQSHCTVSPTSLSALTKARSPPKIYHTNPQPTKKSVSLLRPPPSLLTCASTTSTIFNHNNNDSIRPPHRHSSPFSSQLRPCRRSSAFTC